MSIDFCMNAPRPVPRGAAAAAALALAALLAGCASGGGDGDGRRGTRFHSLLAPPQAAREAPAASREAVRPLAWSLAPVTVPAGVDRPQWVVRAPDGTLAVLENERWIAPLADDLRAALAERLARPLGPEGAAAPAGRSRWRIALDVRRFESEPARSARLDAGWTVTVPGSGAGRDPAAVCSASFEQPVARPGYLALADAHRQALDRLAGAVAATVSALDRGQPATCGG